MSKLDKLEQLADAASVVDHNENSRWYSESELTQHVHYAKNSRLIAACDPQTIKQMVALIRRMGNAMSHIDPRINYAYDIDTEREYLDAVAAFKAFERGEP